MKVLRKGDPGQVLRFRTACLVCRCEFEFATDDKGVTVDHKGPSDAWLYVTCPECARRGLYRLPPPALVPLP